MEFLTSGGLWANIALGVLANDENTVYPQLGPTYNTKYPQANSTYNYIVVGSGAGGSPCSSAGPGQPQRLVDRCW
ncbi:uncharacterized protein BCR38DRAFT_483766 [Pseudomassariella vexata]|uniref:Glucose-methanol-choline oxidoreductase N-terminal domain-containing protein n=1 Tax=Pseudomassariella vexata TaxID=1141098 RepID=A0A1Y2E3I0_9PEZI|nr:uncharacterized protein BCR38DRAFT_483766 [Pseudomassariella vexata]ORY66110.1 hypothetical protein BCR38DRAFT_483766 [Pseudomassariella vexata]